MGRGGGGRRQACLKGRRGRKTGLFISTAHPMGNQSDLTPPPNGQLLVISSENSYSYIHKE